jgi:hypothetical protein
MNEPGSFQPRPSVVTLIAAELDQVSSLAAMSDLAGRLPRARLQTLRGAAHMTPFTDPAALGPADPRRRPLEFPGLVRLAGGRWAGPPADLAGAAAGAQPSGAGLNRANRLPWGSLR